MWPNQQFPADLVTITDEILNGKLHFQCSGSYVTSDFNPHCKNQVKKIFQSRDKSKTMVKKIFFFISIFPRTLQKKNGMKIFEKLGNGWRIVSDIFSFSTKHRSSHQRCSVKKVFLKISQKENTCTGVSFLIKLQAEGLQLF